MTFSSITLPNKVPVLIVDDEPAITKIISKSLQSDGYTCMVTNSGNDALALLDKYFFDVVITDIRMPGISGVELLEHIILKHNADVMIMTGFTEEYNFESLVMSGASDFIQKPIDPKVLSIRLKRVLHMRYLLLEREITNQQFQKNVEQLLQYSGKLKTLSKELRRNSTGSGDQAVPAAENTPPDLPPNPDPPAGSDPDAETLSSDPGIAAPLSPGTNAAENGNLLHRLSQEMFDLVLTTDMEGNFKSISGSVDLMGYEPSALIGKHVLEFVHPTDLAEAESSFAELAGSLKNQKGIFRCQQADGGYLWLETIGDFMVDENGDPFEITLYTRDVTRFKQMESRLEQMNEDYNRLLNKLGNQGRIEEKLRESSNRLFTILDGIEALVYIADMQSHKLLFINSYGRKIWGDVTGGKCWRVILGNKDAPCKSCTKDKLLTEDGAPARGYGRTFRNESNGRWYDCRVGVVPWMDGQLVKMGVAQDITRRKQAEKECETLKNRLNRLESPAAAGALEAGVLNELNSMLNIISGYTELSLEDVGAAVPLHENLKEVQGAARRASEIAQKIDVSSEKKTAGPAEIDLNRVIEKSLDWLQRLIGKNRTLVWKPGNAEQFIRMDSLQMNQVLNHLCSNARDAIDGEGTVTIETEIANLYGFPGCENQNNPSGTRSFAVLRVSDTGCGMAGNVLDQIFEPSFTTKETGSGLGLPTVYDIVRQNDGFIHVNSVSGKGSTFTIHFPLRAGGKSIETSPGMNKAATILLVENEPSMMTLIRKILEKKGYEVLATDSPQNALELASVHGSDIDLLVTDLFFQAMSGTLLASKLCSLHPNLRVLFMSGYGKAGSAEERIGKDSQIIRKPFSQKDFAAAVQKALETQKPLRKGSRAPLAVIN